MRFFYSFLLSTVLLLGSACCATAQALDVNFSSGLLAAGGIVQAAIKQPDGKVIISGDFHLFNGQASARVARLNADGSPDLSFRAQAGSGPDGTILSLALQADGKILLGAQYRMTSYNGQPVQSIVRLNPDGSLDSSFGAGGTLWQGGFIGAIAVQADGKILVAGNASSTFNGQPTKGIIRLLPSGQLDTSFAIGTGLLLANGGGGFIIKLLVQPDGAILAGGQFSSFDGQSRPLLVRLLPSGSLDTSFASLASVTPTNGYLADIARQPDGKLVLGGDYLTGTNSNGIDMIRLLPNGTLDPTFSSNQSHSFVASVSVRPNGTILAAGSFATFGGSPRGGLVRLSSTGAVDPTFATGGGTPSLILTLVELNNGQLMAGGGISRFDGQPANGLVRLTTAGGLDASYPGSLDLVVGNGQLTALNNGQLLLNGLFTTIGGQAVNYPTGNGPHFFLLNANSTYNSQPALPAPSPRAAGGTYYYDVMPQADGTYFAAYQSTDSAMQVRHILGNGTFDAAYASVLVQFNPTNAGGYPSCCGGITFKPHAGGGLLVRGAFYKIDGQPRRYLARLNADGTLNPQFAPPTNAVWQVPNVGVGNTAGFRDAYGLANGQTLVLWNDNTRSYLVRLHVDGSLDNTFSIGTGGGANALFSVLPLAGGKILVTGSFTVFGGQAAPYGVVRLLANGTPDASFTAASAADNAVEQPDSKLVAVAPGATIQRQRLLRFNTDGSLDTGFQVLIVGNESYRPAAARVYLQPGSNALLLTGDFTSVDGQPRFGLARVVNTTLAVRSATAALLAEVFPNPAHELLSVRLPAAPTGPATVADVQGRLVRRWVLARATDNLPLHSLAPGLYLLSVPTAVGIVQQRFAVE